MPDSQQPCILRSPVAPAEPCTLGNGHWGGCSWEPEDSWRAIPDQCPQCGEANQVEIRQDLTPGHGVKTSYRCHSCGAQGAAVPRR